MTGRALGIVVNSLVAVFVTILLCTTPVERIQLLLASVISLVAVFFAGRIAVAKPHIPFAMLSWGLSVLAYMVLILDGFLGGFGRSAPLELIFAPASAVSGLLCLANSFRVRVMRARE